MLTAKKDDFEKIYNILYEAFPIYERRTKEKQLELFGNDKYKVFIDSKQVNVFMAVWDFNNFAFLEHFAVTSSMRGKNIGSDFFKTVVKELNKTVIWEVELPSNDIAKRRIEFYKKLGAKLNNFEYIQPSLQKGQGTIPLLIMSYPSLLDENAFFEIKSTIYKHVYNQK